MADDKKVKPVEEEEEDEDINIVDKFLRDRKKSGKKRLLEIE